jgi:DNA invertase Pin-like site-specific DNA recombinase
MPYPKRIHRTPVIPTPGWALYLRTSSEDAQNPENSQRRQRHAIENALLLRTPLPIFQQYIDNLSGTSSAQRLDYQRMLEDARLRRFSHVAVENAERFGRNDTEALSAIDELHTLGIAVRFADYPDLDPIDPDDRILVSLSFTLARRESIKLGQRVRGGMYAKLRTGGFVGKAPDGYLNCEQKTETAVKTEHGKYTRWIELDPDRAPIWRLAWELLLSDTFTLEAICQELHQRGYCYRSGRAFVETRADGKRVANFSSLSRIFHNWFYAGWLVSEKAQIAPKTVRGQWTALVSTEAFERGLALLAHRSQHRVATRKFDYLLKGMIFVQLYSEQPAIPLTGSTSNSGRAGGGTPYYCISRSAINIPCATVETQLAECLHSIQIDPQVLPSVRAAYTAEVAQRLGHLRPDEAQTLRAALKAIDQEESRALRLFAIGKISEPVWDQLWSDWQQRRHGLTVQLHALQQNQEVYITNLNDALTLIAKIGILYSKLERSHQKDLLRHIVERVVVDPEGRIIRMELLPPFAYLNTLFHQVTARNTGNDAGKTKTSQQAGQCSDWLALGDPNGTRTRVLALKGLRPRPLDDRAVMLTASTCESVSISASFRQGTTSPITR